MENKLQKILNKFNENFDWNEYRKVMDYLNEVLNNCETLTSDEIKYLISFQEVNGAFSLAEESFIPNLPWEGILDFIYFPSYYITLILVKYSNQINSSNYKEEIKKALDFCCNRKFTGHGFDSMKTQIDTANLFVDNGIKQYITNNHLEDSAIAKLLNELNDNYTQRLLTGKYYGDWGESYLEDMQRFVNSMDDSIYYVAYGSNLNKKQMMQRCPEAECICSSILENYKLTFNLYLTVEENKNYNVPVGIWKITKNDERKLDRYEGYPRIYRKEYVKVKVNGINRRCLIYIMNYIEGRMNCKPTLEYLERCKKGYSDFGFNPEELEKYL